MVISERHLFYVSGPSHLTSIDWKNTDHQRSVAASLVQGVKVLELNRQEKHKGGEALAPHWWEFFHFRLHGPIMDDATCSIFGAIYECSSHSYTDDQIGMFQDEAERPHFVIAFRGTMAVCTT